MLCQLICHARRSQTCSLPLQTLPRAFWHPENFAAPALRKANSDSFAQTDGANT